jgi:hypothetical protein
MSGSISRDGFERPGFSHAGSSIKRQNSAATRKSRNEFLDHRFLNDVVRSGRKPELSAIGQGHKPGGGKIGHLRRVKASNRPPKPKMARLFDSLPNPPA